MPAEVHLPESILGVDEALGHEEVVGVTRLNGRDARVIAGDADLGVQARQ